jgi:hypothetical protein
MAEGKWYTGEAIFKNTMNLKLIDPKIVMTQVAFLVAGGAIVGTVWIGVEILDRAQSYEDPTQRVIIKDGLLR